MAEFDDGKDDGALRTIGEVSEALDIKPHVLRYWEQQFSLLSPLKRSGGRRYYRPEDVAMVERIDQLVNAEGYTLKGAEAVLRASSGGEHDRRQGERRQGDRRGFSDQDPAIVPASLTAPLADEADASAEQQELTQSDMSEAVEKLKAIRSRLKKAIEA